MAADAALLRRFVSDCVSCIEVSGLSIRFGTDFQEFRRLVSRQPLRGQVAPIFDAGCGHVKRGNAFWVAVWDRAGELVATEALFLADRVLVLSPRPGKLRRDMRVDLPRPRLDEMRYTASFGEMVNQVRAEIG